MAEEMPYGSVTGVVAVTPRRRPLAAGGTMTSTTTCLFCRIAAGDEPADVLVRTDDVIAFADKFPRAPVHVLIAPVRHLDSIHELGTDDAGLLSACFSVARQVAEEAGVAQGYRVVTNVGEQGGQSVAHLHFHVVGGKQLGHVDGT